MDIIQKIKEELKVEKWQVEAAVKLIDEGNTIPFISRYRKEVTGSLNDEQLRNLHERLVYLRNLEEKKEQVLGSIEEQGKLTEELKAKILAAETLVVVEDLYRPYRPKRKTRASIAKEKGLDGLAEFILAQNTQAPVIEEAAKYVTPEGTDAEKQVKTPEEALQRRVILRDQGKAGQTQMVFGLKEVQEHFPQLIETVVLGLRHNHFLHFLCKLLDF